MPDIAGGTFLVTGGASLIGSHLADALLGAGAAEVRLLDNFSLGTPELVRHLDGDARVKLIRGDVLRLNEVIDAAQGAAGVVALAAFLTLPLSQNAYLGASVNTVGVLNTLEAARLAGVHRLILSSSIATYGNSQPERIDEGTPFTGAGQQPATNLYGTSKLFGEAACAQYARAYGLEFNVLRFSSVYGERQHARAVNAVFMAETYRRVARGERPVIVGDGSEVHDYIHVTDVAAACVAALASASHGNVMNIATGVDTTLNRVVEIVLDVSRCVAPATRASGGHARGALGQSRPSAPRPHPRRARDRLEAKNLDRGWHPPHRRLVACQRLNFSGEQRCRRGRNEGLAAPTCT